MSAEDYEQVVSEIVGSIYKEVEGIPPEQIKVGRKNKWRGVSGYSHQIDVSVNGNNDIIMVECKKLKRRISADAVLVFAARIIDIKQALKNESNYNDKEIHAVIVTSKGAQKGAKELAKHFNIDLQEVISANQFGIHYKKLSMIGVRCGELEVTGLPATIIVTNSQESTANENSG